MKSVQRGNRHLLPGAGQFPRGRSFLGARSLGRRARGRRRLARLRGQRKLGQEQSGQQEGSDLHFCSPFVAGAGAGDFGASVSITATVRFSSRNVLLATRRISALVTLSRLSIWRKSSRQSP